MKQLPAAILAVALFSFGLPSFVSAQQQQPELLIEKRSEDSVVAMNVKDQIAVATNGVIIKFRHPVHGAGVLVADAARVDLATQEVLASGHVRIQRDDLVWAGENVRYNFATRKMEAVQFRAGGAAPGSPPAFVVGENLGGSQSNNVYSVQHAFLTTDDAAEPANRIRASSITIVPGQYFEARNAVLYMGKVPVFYFPYYTQRLDGRGNHFDFVPGYRSRHGYFLLSTYNWMLDEHLDGALHGDYRTKRGGAGGADFNLHLGPWGESTVRYYYAHDQDPTQGGDNAGYDIPADRQRVDFSYRAEPATNLHVLSRVRYQTDARMLQNFFEREYRDNPQPNSFLEVNKVTDDFSLDVFAQPQVNEFLETVERLPEVRLTGFRQPVFGTPVYYDSESSVGYYRRQYAVSNDVPTGLDYTASRADTYQQLTLPQTFFGWLNVIPRAGGRFSYYGEASGPGGTNAETTRAIFNTGAEVTFKASQTWAGTTNRLFALDGLRHIIEPSVNYVYVPDVSHGPDELPQFDTELPSLRLLPIEYPDYNSIDSIDSQNVIRLGLRNRLQTKRGGQLQNFIYWDVYTDWRLQPENGQSTFSDLYSDLVFRPRSWLTLEAQNRFDLDAGQVRLSFVNLVLQPNDRWSWAIGHLYVRDDLNPTPTALQAGNSSLTSTFYFRVSENWGLRARHQYEVSENWLQEQDYGIYRDLRNWTAAIVLRLRDNHTSEDDIGVAFTFSLKAAPKHKVGGDAVNPGQLLGY
jgi:lipopolysaccharide assembly outer membrane protein LptD (OstA)